MAPAQDAAPRAGAFRAPKPFAERETEPRREPKEGRPARPGWHVRPCPTAGTDPRWRRARAGPRVPPPARSATNRSRTWARTHARVRVSVRPALGFAAPSWGWGRGSHPLAWPCDCESSHMPAACSCSISAACTCSSSISVRVRQKCTRVAAGTYRCRCHSSHRLPLARWVAFLFRRRSPPCARAHDGGRALTGYPSPLVPPSRHTIMTSCAPDSGLSLLRSPVFRSPAVCMRAFACSGSGSDPCSRRVRPRSLCPITSLRSRRRNIISDQPSGLSHARPTPGCSSSSVS